MAKSGKTEPVWPTTEGAMVTEYADLAPASTPSPGGGGGGGGGYEDPYCVAATMYLDDGTQAGGACAGDVHWTHDPVDGFRRNSILVCGEAVLQPCVRIVTRSGAGIVCSRKTPFTHVHAPADLPEYTTMAPHMLGHDVIVERGGLRLIEPVLDVQDAGEMLVVPIDFGGRSFAAGEDKGALIYSHNIRKAYSGQYPEATP